jgi:hypothetical protein
VSTLKLVDRLATAAASKNSSNSFELCSVVFLVGWLVGCFSSDFFVKFFVFGRWSPLSVPFARMAAVVPPPAAHGQPQQHHQRHNKMTDLTDVSAISCVHILFFLYNQHYVLSSLAIII